jgi:DNA-binding transcriptional regulator GbsR (MarR family)
MDMSSSRLSLEQKLFVNDLADLLSTWSLTAHAARLYGYLQIVNEPVSLDDIARDLEMSRSHAHTAARMLEEYGNARSLSTRGSRRLLYVAGDDPGTPLRRQVQTLGRMSEMIAERRSVVAQGVAAERLERLAKFHRRLHDAMNAVIDPD